MKLAAFVMIVMYLPWPMDGQRLVPPRNYHSDDEDDLKHALNDEEEHENNTTGKKIFH